MGTCGWPPLAPGRPAPPLTLADCEISPLNVRLSPGFGPVLGHRIARVIPVARDCGGATHCTHCKHHCKALCENPCRLHVRRRETQNPKV